MDANGNFRDIFQFTPLHERQRIAPLYPAVPALFQFTPLHERQQSQLELATMYNDFNSRLYMRGNTVYPVHGRHYNPDFNSRLYMRGNSSCVCSKVYEESISIHAST